MSSGVSSETLTNIPDEAISRPWCAIPFTKVMAGAIWTSSLPAMPMVRGYTDTTLRDSPTTLAMSDILPK